MPTESNFQKLANLLSEVPDAIARKMDEAGIALFSEG